MNFIKISFCFLICIFSVYEEEKNHYIIIIHSGMSFIPYYNTNASYIYIYIYIESFMPINFFKKNNLIYLGFGKTKTTSHLSNLMTKILKKKTFDQN